MSGKTSKPLRMQTYRLEIRWDFFGTEDQARAEAQKAANDVGGEVTAIFDEDWEEL